MAEEQGLVVPIHRLLKRREATALLAEFEKLTPGGNLALITADGQVYSGSTEWDQEQLRRLYAQAGEDRAVCTEDVILQPLCVQSRCVGALVARAVGGPEQRRSIESVLRCSSASLALLLTRTLETRDVVSETLHRYREINLLYRIGETIGSCLDPEKIPPLVLGEVQRFLRADAGAVLWSSATGTATGEDSADVAASFGSDEHVRALQRAYSQVSTQTGDESQAAIVNLARQSRPVDGDIGTILCAQMKAQERTLGALVLGRLVGQPEFTAGDGKLAMALTHQAATALETARLHQEEVERQRLEEELEIGRQIQLSLLPERCPVVPGWEFAATYRAARQVGGDFYDFVQLPDEPQRLSMVIADVTGKGIPSALFMACSRAVIRSESVAGRDPASTLRQANRILVRDMHSRLFLSAFYATLDTGNGHLVYARGGHDSPLWLRGDSGESHWLAAAGFLLGAFQDVELEERTIVVGPGDLLVFYTDGVTEARDSGGTLFGKERLKALVEANAGAGAQQLREAIVTAVEAFAGDTPQSDDLTLFVVKRQQ